jgi:predicted nucleic acid-binding protein
VIVVDASVLIAHLDERDTHHERARNRLLDLAADPLGASPITIAEVLVGPARQRRLEEARAALTTLEVTEIAFGEESSTRLAVLRAETWLQLPDCCVLLTAQESGAQGLFTFDEQLAATASRLGLASVGDA